MKSYPLFLLGVWAASSLLLPLFYSNLGESTDQAMGGFKHFLIHHDPWVKMLQFDTHILPNWMSQAPIIDVRSRFCRQASRHPAGDSLGIPNGKNCIFPVPGTFPSWQSLPRPAHLSIFAWKHWTYLPRFPGSQTFQGKKKRSKKVPKKHKVEKSCLMYRKKPVGFPRMFVFCILVTSETPFHHHFLCDRKEV